jgi:hypothetical protein
MRLLPLSVCILGLTACAPHLSNREIIDAVRYCEQNQMQARLIRPLDSAYIARVQCEPREEVR